MKLLNFISQETNGIAKKQFAFLSVLSGIANSALIVIINHATEISFTDSGLQVRLFFIYVLFFCMFFYTQKLILTQTLLATEKALRNVRVRIADKLRYTEFRFIEQSNRNDWYIRLTQNTAVISDSIVRVISAGQGGILIVGCVIYILWISPLSFLLAFGCLGLTAFMYISHGKKTRQQLLLAHKKESVFFDTLSHFLDGFKEIKLNRAKRNDLFNEIQKTSVEAEQINVVVGNLEVIDWLVVRLGFYTLLPLLAFVIPAIYGEQNEHIYKIIAAILFIIGPTTTLANTIPTFVRVNLALDDFQSLEQEIDSATHGVDDNDLPAWQNFSELQFQELCFSYYDNEKQAVFSSGPNNLTLKKGELLFIVGGNGSGKSTLLKLLTGLYYPSSGAIYRDSDLVNDNNYPSYRELFSTIFTDFHLFNRLYGLANVDKEKVDFLLKEMDLDKKTSYSSEGYFTKTNLSTGQKKRLAFIAAILENKPILIFDELAADQDPNFRRYFYETVLPDLVEQGKTVIAVTHDEMYFHCADRVLKMDNGLLQTYSVS